MPVKYDADQFLLTIAQEARISLDEARRFAPAVTAALVRRCSPGQIEHVLSQLPAPLRQLLTPVGQAEPSGVTARDARAAAAPEGRPGRTAMPTGSAWSSRGWTRSWRRCARSFEDSRSCPRTNPTRSV